MQLDGKEIDLSFGLDGKVALITGAASGIGAAIAKMYAVKGARVAVADVNLEAAEDVAKAIGQGGAAFFCNVTDPGSVLSVTEQVLGSFERIDILVNSAGVVRLAPAEDLSLAAWDATLDINLEGRSSCARPLVVTCSRPATARSLIWHPRRARSHLTATWLIAHRSSG